MASVFLRWPNGTIQQQPAEVAAYFLQRGAEIVEDPAIGTAKSAAEVAEDAAVVAAELVEVDEDAADGELAEEIDPNEDAESDEAVHTTGLGRHGK